MKIVTRCWNCGFENNRVISAFDNKRDRPQDGDLSLCYQCGEYAVFDKTFLDNVRKPTPTEMQHIREDNELTEVRANWFWHKQREK
jgi:hypothetical protein